MYNNANKKIITLFNEIQVPLPECSHSLLDSWNDAVSSPEKSDHKVTLTSALMRWKYLLSHPAQLMKHLTPSFAGLSIPELCVVSLCRIK